MSEPPLVRAIVRNSSLTWVILVTLLALMVDMILRMPFLGIRRVIVDFDAFYIASQMILEGHMDDAYNPGVFIARQYDITGDTIFMPWTYPPQFDLVAAPFSLVPRWVAYSSFTLLSLTAYVLVLRRLAGPFLPGVLVAILPSLIMAVRLGQSGILIAALIGLACLLWLGAEGTGEAWAPLSGFLL